MTRKNGPWRIKESVKKYESKLIELYEDQVIKPDGSDGIYTTLKIAPGVSVLAMDDKKNAYLVKEFRYALGKESVEVVGGAIDKGEDPITAAKRELLEELGIEAEEWTELGRIDNLTSIVDSPAFLFLARGLSFKEKRREGSEVIQTTKIKFDEAVKMALNGEITHGTSCALIFRVNSLLVV
jgi:8-oxo-dGTP pyrophosphatase MutT (NUDIX family)